MIFKIFIAIFLVSQMTQWTVQGKCLETSEIESNSNQIESSNPGQPTTTSSPQISADSVLVQAIATPTPSAKPGQDSEEQLVQQLKLYLSLLDKHIKLSGRPRFGRSVPLAPSMD